MFQELYVAMNVLFVCHFFPGSLNSHVCQHTYKSLSLTFFFFSSLLAQSKHVGWQLLAPHVEGGCELQDQAVG